MTVCYRYSILLLLKNDYLFVAASFSIPSMLMVDESDSIFEVCVTMTTAPLGVMLAKDVELTLSTMNGTGKILLKVASKVRLESLFSASDADGDFIALTMPVTFTSGSSDGAMMCVNVTVVADAMVEGEMNFIVGLTLVTVGESISVGNNSTLVILVDSDGNDRFLVTLDIFICYPPQLLPFQSPLRLWWLRVTPQWRCVSL